MWRVVEGGWGWRGRAGRENLLTQRIFSESSQKEPVKLNRDNKKDPLIYRKTGGGGQGDVTYGEYGCFFFSPWLSRRAHSTRLSSLRQHVIFVTYGRNGVATYGKKGVVGMCFFNFLGPGATTPLEVRRSSGMGASHELPGDSYESEPKTHHRVRCFACGWIARAWTACKSVDRRRSSSACRVALSLRACVREGEARCVLECARASARIPISACALCRGSGAARGAAVGAHQRSRRAPGQPGGDRLPSGAAAHRTSSVGSPTHPSSSAHSQMPPPRAPQQWTACGLCRGSIVIGIVPLRVIKDKIN